MEKENKISEFLSIATEAALNAGTYLLNPEISGKKVTSNAGRDVKITADIKSENIIINILKERSNFSILSEETGEIKGRGQNFTWIIDPLDGTLNYLHNIPLCCVSIGLWQGRHPILGVVYDFYHSELYTGIADKGAWLNGRNIKNSSVNKKENAVLCTGFPINTNFSMKNLSGFIKKVREYKKVRILGSAALSLVYVASGRADAYIERDIMIWDVAGGLAIAKGSGCRCDIRDGANPNSLCVTVSNGNLTLNNRNS